MEQRSAGWYADPVTVGAARYWDGRGWTDLIAWGGVTAHDPTPLREVERREAQAEAAVVSDLLADAERRGVVSHGVADAIRRDTEARTRPLTAPVAIQAPPSPVALPPPSIPTPPVSTPPAATARPEPVEALRGEPGRIARWWDDAGHAVRSDLALHGLAYLGVLLLFAGVTGLIAFSFGEVAPWVRSVTELLVPSALFLSAWYLSRRGASVVGTSLTLLGGAISPIVVAASLTDGAPIPPDPSGRGLPIAQGLAVAAVAIAMVVIVRRSPSSPLRFVAGPAAWLAAGLAAGATRDPIPAGYEVVRPDSLQLAVVLAAVTVTTMLCSWRRVPRALADSTRAVALPVAGVVYAIELVLAGDEGWPLTGTIVTGLAVLVTIELLADRLPAFLVSSLEFLVVAVSAARLSARAEPEWIAVGAGIALLALVEYAGWRRPAWPTEVVGLIVAGSAFVLTLPDAAAAAVAFGAVAFWGLWRHVTPARWLPITDDVGVVPAVAAVVATAALWDLSAPAPALVVTSAVLLLVALAGRLWRPIADDTLWRWFVPTAAVALPVVSTTFPWGDAPGRVAAAAAMSATALVLSVLPVAARTWLTAATVAWSLANMAAAFDVGREARSVALAGVALALLSVALAVGRPICVHLASIGHLAGLAALAVSPWPGWSATVVVAAATAGLWATTAVDEHGEAVHLAALRAALGEASVAAPTGELAPFSSLVGLWGTTILAVDAAGWIAVDDAWAAAVSAGVGLVGAVIVRSVPWRRAHRGRLGWLALLVAASAAVAAVFGAVADRDHWSPVVSIALMLAVVAVTASPRPPAFVWVGWVGAGSLSVLLADRFGLDREWTDVAIATWGAAALVGGLAAQRRRHGPASSPPFVTDRLLLPPVVLGAIAFTIGGILGLTDGSSDEIGWTAAGMSLVVLATAGLLPLGALVGPAEVLATAAYVLLAPWEPLERPWTLAPWALLVLVAALATRRSGEWSAARWDLPSFFVAHGIAGLALAVAAESGELAVTYVLFGGLSVAVSAMLRRWPWAAAGALLVLVGGIDAGGGWFALVLLVEGVALTVIGLLRTGSVRWALLSLGALSLVGAWFDLAAWQSWSPSTVYYATTPVAAVVALVAAAGVRGGRRVRLPRELGGVWAIAGGVVTLGTGVIGIDDVGRRPGGLVLAGSLVILAAAAGTTAVVVGSGMRWVAAGLAAAAWGPTAWALEASDTAVTLTGTTVALVAVGAALAAHGFMPTSVWIRPGAFHAVATQLGAAGVAMSALPDTDLLAVVLLAVAIELVAVGVLTDRPELYVLSPAPALGAWLLYARGALAGDPNWFTVPIGLTVLVMVGLVRWIRRGRGGDPTGLDIVAVELVGMSFLVGAALARTLGGHLWNGVLAVAIGVLVAGWGAITRVRWRAAFGAGAVVLAVVLLIGVPLSASVTWRGPTLWVTLSLIGIAAIVAAGALERGREEIRRAARRLDRMTEGWERIAIRPRRIDDDTPEPAPHDEPSDEPHLVG